MSAPDAAAAASIPASAIDLDHVAIAVESQAEAWPRYAGELGGQWQSGGESIGFNAAQLKFANGFKLEVLQPANVHINDFLRRFLDRNGPGPHHLTFKVKDIVAAMASAEAAGYRPINAQLDDPDWKEAFLHPKDAPGVVVQLAQSSEREWVSPKPESVPTPNGPTAALAHVAHGVNDMDEGLRLFEGLLSASRLDAGEDADGKWVEVGWRGPGRVRLIVPHSQDSELGQWLAGRAGRVWQLVFRTPNGADVTGARPAADGVGWVVPAAANLGTRLRLLP